MPLRPEPTEYKRSQSGATPDGNYAALHCRRRARVLYMQDEALFPNIITNLPQADIPIDGLTSHLLQGANHQVVFMCFKKDIEVPEHSHESQWGVVLEGEIVLTINVERQIYKKGDTYFIPKNVPHSAKIKAGYKDVTLFNQKDRYKPKSKR